MFCFVVVCLFWLCCATYRILVPQPRNESRPSKVREWSSNHWTAREFSPLPFLALKRTWLCFESCTPGVLKPAFHMEFTYTRRWLPDPSGSWGLPDSLAPVNPQTHLLIHQKCCHTASWVCITWLGVLNHAQGDQGSVHIRF